MAVSSYGRYGLLSEFVRTLVAMVRLVLFLGIFLLLNAILVNAFALLAGDALHRYPALELVLVAEEWLATAVVLVITLVWFAREFATGVRRLFLARTDRPLDNDGNGSGPLLSRDADGPSTARII